MSDSSSPLKVGSYPFLLASRFISSAILWVDFTLIFSSLSYIWHASATTIGIGSALYGLPGLLLGPLIGRAADRRDPFSVLLASYCVRGTVSLALVFAPSVEIFLALILFKGIGNLAVMPAEQALVRRVLAAEQLAANAGWMTIADQFTKILTPLAVAGWTLYASAQSGFSVSAALSIVGMLCIVRMRSVTSKRKWVTDGPKKSIKLSALFLLYRGSIEFRLAFIALMVQSCVLGLYDPMLALFLKERGLPPDTFGIIVSSTAAGAILGAMFFKRLRRQRLSLICAALAGFGLTVLLPGVIAMTDHQMPVALLIAFWLFNGCFYALVAMSFAVVMQTTCPFESIGTVSATARSIQLAALVAGPLLGSVAARATTLPTVFVLSGGTAMLLSAGLLVIDGFAKRPRSFCHD
jgi:MFS family permease